MKSESFMMVIQENFEKLVTQINLVRNVKFDEYLWLLLNSAIETRN